MSTAPAQVPAAPVASVEDRPVTYKPLGASEEITLTVKQILSFLVHPTRSGRKPEIGQVIPFMMLCKSNLLDPWAGDAYMVGYDTKDGPVFNNIVAAQALFKRAEMNKEFDGITSGVIVKPNDESKQFEMREGCFYLAKHEVIAGGWARVKRKNTSDSFYESLNFDVYSTGRSRWVVDPAGMIVKCAKAAALRQAFPTTCANSYTPEEMEHVLDSKVVESKTTTTVPVTNLKELAARKPAEKAIEKKEATNSDDHDDYINAMLKKVCSISSEEEAEPMMAEIIADKKLSQEERDRLTSMLEARFS